MKFKFDSIKQSSESMIKMLEKVFNKYHKDINSLKYTLELDEVMKVA